MGNRISQDNGTNVTNYLLDLQAGLTRVLSKTVGANVTRFVHSPRGIHSAYDGTDWVDMLQDGLGSVRSQVDAMGQISADQLYDPYGQVIDEDGTWIGSFGYAGEQRDESGLGYNRARYYNPAMGAFASLDPFEGITHRPMSMNGYSYAENNPTNWTDPSGNMIAIGEFASVSPTPPPSPTAFMDKLFCGQPQLVQPNDGGGVITIPPPTTIDPGDDLLLWLILLLVFLGVITLPKPKPPKQKGNEVVYRGLDAKGNGRPATNPGQFRIDADGLSTFELDFLPAIKPWALPYLVAGISIPTSPGECGTVELLDMTCKGCYTPQFGEGHWSISCPVPDETAKLSHQAYAIKANEIGAIIPNPNIISSS